MKTTNHNNNLESFFYKGYVREQSKLADSHRIHHARKHYSAKSERVVVIKAGLFTKLFNHFFSRRTNSNVWLEVSE